MFGRVDLKRSLLALFLVVALVATSIFVYSPNAWAEETDGGGNISQIEPNDENSTEGAEDSDQAIDALVAPATYTNVNLSELPWNSGTQILTSSAMVTLWDEQYFGNAYEVTLEAGVPLLYIVGDIVPDNGDNGFYPDIYILDSSGEVVSSSWNSLVYAPQQQGIYYIVVATGDQDFLGSYTLTIENPPNEDGFVYQLYEYYSEDIEDNTCGVRIVGYTGDSPDVVVPETLDDDYPVKEIVLNGTDITSLDVSACTELTYLECNGTQNDDDDGYGEEGYEYYLGQLESLTVVDATKLYSISVQGNKLTELELSGLVNLSSLNCSYNDLDDLDLTGLDELNSLYCLYNHLTDLDISGNESLDSFDCSYNDIVDLDLLDSLVARFDTWNIFPQNLVVVTFDPNNGGVESPFTEIYNNNEEFGVLPKDPTPPSDKVFSGWYTAKTGGNKISVNDWAQGYNGNPTYYAHYSSLGDTYFITDWNGNIIGYSGSGTAVVPAKLNDKTVQSINISTGNSVSWDLTKATSLKTANFQFGSNIKGVTSKNAKLETLNIAYAPDLTKLDIKGDTALKTLQVNAPISALDLSKNTKLTSLNIDFLVKVKSLNLTKNVALTSATINSPITALDVSKNTKLKTLNLNYNTKVKSLNLTKNTALTSLDVISPVASLDLSKNTKLTSLTLQNGTLSKLALSKNTKLTTLSLSDNAKLATLDVSKNTALKDLTVRSCSIAKLSLSKNKSLTKLNVSDNAKLTGLSLTANTKLTQLTVGYSPKITSLGLSKNTVLTNLQITGSRLKSLDVSKNTKLTVLLANYSGLSSLNVSKNTKLTYLECYYNKLATLDVSKNTKLTSLNCYSNKLKTLNLSKNTNLNYLNVSANDLTALNLGANTKLTTLYCTENKISSVATLNTLIGKFGYSNVIPQKVAKGAGEYGNFTVNFDANGGTVNPASVTRPYGAAYGGLPVPTLEDKVFLGWYTYASWGGRISSTSKVNNNQTLYAHWADNTRSLTFELNDQTTNLDGYDKPFRDYMNYSVKNTGSGTSYYPEYSIGDGNTRTVVFKDLPEGSYTYSGFTALNVKKHGGSNNERNDVYLPYSGEFEQSSALGDAVEQVTVDFTNDDYSKVSGKLTNEKSVGISGAWSTEVSGSVYSVAYTNSDGYYDNIISAKIPYGSNLKAINSVKVLFAGKGYFSQGYKNVKLAAKTNGWATSAELAKMTALNVKGGNKAITNTTAKLISTADKYVVDFNANGGSAVIYKAVKKNAKVGTLTTPKKTGYKFLGWYTTKTGGTKIKTTTPVKKNITYYAHWKKK
ncbi:MAG: InlB B-repeat-containing protein [Clostridiales Family XIII bacterium]|jgi:uncharacterized repeat protein (TIGR02543 family)|nr:InlB B-repeat-containing protein [Clostridiales Family XIII bacterium]